jgi:hypothetical protein
MSTFPASALWNCRTEEHYESRSAIPDALSVFEKTVVCAAAAL